MFLRMKVHGRTAMERIVRTLLLAVVILTVMWAFWENNERVIERLNSNKIVVDETKMLTQEEVEFAQKFLRGLRAEFGLDGKIHVFKGQIVTPNLDSRTVFIGISPLHRAVKVHFPGLISKALGREYLDKIQTTFFAPFWESGEWRSGLSRMLMDIWMQLEEESATARDGEFEEPDQPEKPKMFQDPTKKMPEHPSGVDSYSELDMDSAGERSVEVVASDLPEVTAIIEKQSNNEVLGTLTQE